MDLPSMVQRSGDTLIVRSVVSGNQLYTEQGGHQPTGNKGHISSNSSSNTAATQAGSSLLERHVERFRLQQLLQQQQQAAAAVAVVNSVQQQQQQQHQQQAVIGMDAKEEGLPQCKIKRNYSCNHCAYFTQNPRYHLTHLRDVHGEKIVINKCKLCLYASRHFQKLVRHMKMVHGCTDGIPSGHGQARGKRGMSREARKRRLEESVGVMGGQSLTVSVPDMPTLEQVKRELLLQEEKLQRDIQAFNQRQREEQQREQRELELATTTYERQMQVLRDYERQSPAEPPTPSPTSGSATPPSNGEEPQNRLLKCSACEFTTLYRTQLRAHELAEHGKTKFFRCDKCSYVTHIKARFSKHVKYHSMPMIKCVTCDFRTPYKWNLDRHMKNHGGAGAFKCAACDFTADIKQSLTVHEMNHHVPPVGNAGSIWPRRQNKVGASEMCDDFLSDSAELEDQYNNNNVDDELDVVEDPDDAMSGGEEQSVHLHHYGKRSKYDEEEEPTDLSQKGGCSSDTSSVGTPTPRAQRPMPNLIPISKGAKDVLNLSKETNASRSSLTEIASMFFNEKQISEMLDKSDVPQLSPATTVASQNSSRSQMTKKSSFMDKLKTGAQHENLVCQCGHVAKCLSESIIHGKTCHASAVIIDDEDAGLHEDDADDRLEIDEDDEDHHSHSALNLSVTGSTRCQHCRHRCKSSTDLLHHLKQCVEAIRCANEMYDSNSGESGDRRPDSQSLQQQAAVQQQRVCIWNKATKEIVAAAAAASMQQENNSHSLIKSPAGSQAASNEENSYYGVETAPGYGEVTKKMTPEEEAANSSLKKVYKCPHCSFWASTASRFHVHIVGHLNKKPFECSLCSYRSNWRWDITKHIRLKTIRDPSHKTAKVLMNDETGRRNYTKYNKYITLMKVTEEDGDPKLMKSGEMTPNQVASLAFLKDYAKVGSVTGQDITLEPVLPNKPNVLDDAHLADNLIRIPLLATMMNAAMAQQQHQQQQQQKDHQSTMITPSVTISPVKRSNQGSVMQGKPSDDLITEVHQEGNEKRTVYRCRKCNFGHQNRDAVLAHVKIHYQDANYPKSNSANSNTSPLQVSVGGNQQFYMNKVFAAMCLSQTQSQSSPNSGSAGTSPAISAGLLQRAIQEAQHSPTPNASALSGLALALAGGKPQANTTKASAASILEHGEQKASQNEASADSLTSPNTTTTSRTTKATTSTTKDTARSLQDLLTSPRSARNGNHLSNANSNSVVGNGLRQDVVYVASSTTTNNTTQPLPTNSVSKPNASPLPVTTTPTPISTATPPAISKSLAHQLGAGNHSSSSSHHNDHPPLMAGEGYHLASGLTHAHSINTNTKANPNSKSFPSSSSSSSSSSSVASTSSAAGSASASASSSSTSSPPPPAASSSYLAVMAQQQQAPPALPMPHPPTRFHSHSPGSPSLLTTADGDRRDPSPYRCGHCHQVSNWKHVIQRHCRLKHSGDIRIETLERGASVSANAPPIYRPMGAGASNESQSHILSNPTSNILKHSSNTNASNNNSAQLLMTTKQLEQLLHSPLSASAAAVVNAANTQQDIQAAAAVWAAACNAMKACSSAEELQQLQQNDQIEITRLPSSVDHSISVGNNTKSKQQKCPVCPYISESKSQMNYHVSLHKPTQYECRLCTFVCAKKQHLSSHMRSVHQQQMSVSGPPAGGGLDYSMALQLAAAAKQVQQLPASTPLSIDLSQVQLDAASDAELNPQQLPPEYQYKLISYCPRCPARFAQKHNDERNAKQELEKHLLAHTDHELEDQDQGYVCAYCEYRTAEETMLQLHRAVHMSHYQEKCQQLYKNCKEDSAYPAPKLLQLTGPETIWVVDNELSLQLLQQTTGGGVSSSTGSFDNQNSLLKKQLESGNGQVVTIPRETTVTKNEGEAPEEDEERHSSSTPSTSASVATSDLAADASSDAGSVDMPQSIPAPERCLHCPFETQQHDELLQHLQKHACVNPPPPSSQQCAHCDYNGNDESEIEEHTTLHFNASEKLKSVEFFTCYDQLEISVERDPEETDESKIQQTEHNNNQDNVMNANMQQGERTQEDEAADEGMEEPPAKNPSTKLILYKNESGLSVKPSHEEATLESQKSENISDRLRRRTLRGSANQTEDNHVQERPTTPDKMILVNAKTGKVISRK
ncbi:LOW QUALITY PROTEIN: uncharacterized protein LOC108108145 [Drosophila eugracilis]|uniref:LOW QUALITY PROTEIN: uncharacterized protein LOC108108145 n=1 Tax=Drosophila eugracilis TaxID=29029 RepID=UPI001BDB4432|nr:LOW QUALITY PROTEIN: uncharacterized protein LOC108108145 [Drosophila eugracilis]